MGSLVYLYLLETGFKMKIYFLSSLLIIILVVGILSGNPTHRSNDVDDNNGCDTGPDGRPICASPDRITRGRHNSCSKGCRWLSGSGCVPRRRNSKIQC